VIRFASIRFDHALGENDRSAFARVLASRGARATSWANAGDRTYALIDPADSLDVALASEYGALVDDPACVVVRIRPVLAARVESLARVLCDGGAPGGVLRASVCDDEIVAELEPTARALRLVLALVDATLAATPGRTIVPVLPLSDELLADFTALRIREPDLDVSRVLDPYVEGLLANVQAHA
jgi:hypothetical protein